MKSGMDVTTTRVGEVARDRSSRSLTSSSNVPLLRKEPLFPFFALCLYPHASEASNKSRAEQSSRSQIRVCISDVRGPRGKWRLFTPSHLDSLHKVSSPPPRLLATVLSYSLLLQFFSSGRGKVYSCVGFSVLSGILVWFCY